MSPAAKDPHEKAFSSLFLFVGRLIPGGELRGPRTDLYLEEDALQPDIFWIAPDNTRCKLGEDGYWYGAPDLVVEVLSPSTEAKDRGAKFEIYEKHGVREYWLVNPDARFIEVYRLSEGKFEKQGLFVPGQAFASAVLGGQTVEVGAIIIVSS